MNDEYLAVTELDKFAKIYCRKKEQEKDRIECAIRHIESSLDVDPWAREIAVNAMEKQIPKKLQNLHRFIGREKCVGTCPTCGYVYCSDYGDYCGGCGQAICWKDGE